MKTIKRMLLRLTLLCQMVGAAAYAQNPCYAYVDTYIGQCSSQSCWDYYPLQVVHPCNEGACFCRTTNSTNCCGVTIVYNQYEVGPCYPALLKDKDVQSDFLALASKEHILVPSCNGAYLPFELVRNEFPEVN